MRRITTLPIRRFGVSALNWPSILVVSVPKSGTVYLNSTLGDSLGLRNVQLCNGYFPQDHVSVDRLHRFVSRGGYIASTHLDPSPANLHLLETLLPHWIVHVRDPRASLLSWVHHVRRLHREHEQLALMRVCPTPSDSVLTASLLDCIDWHIDRYDRPLVAWISAWVQVADAWPHRVLLTEFTALHDDDRALCQEMAAFVGYAPTRYRHRPAARTMANHFRVGALNEWQQVFTRDQVRRTTAMLAPEQCQRFDWPFEGAPMAATVRDQRPVMQMAAAEPGD